MLVDLEPAQVRATVFERDGYRCIVRRYDPEHVCGNTWGADVPYGDFGALTLEHVRMQPGGRRITHPAFCVTMCHRANVVTRWGSGWPNRLRLNAYLDDLYPGRREGYE